jgi:hypothetical protein
MILLGRDEFRAACLRRDKYQCVVCHEKDNLAVHHVLERRLFSDGSYYIDNGVSLCEQHHLEAEMTTLSCEELRKLVGIKEAVLPEHFTSDSEYDKWGNPVLNNGMRLRGELFFEEPVQKMLTQGNVLSLFTQYVKYPRTYHLPWSPGLINDDRMLQSCAAFEGQEVVITVKMDGENTTMYPDYLHARSLEYHAHPSRNKIKQLHATIARDIPDNYRLCGENVFAKHSIQYANLDSHFYLFSVWNEKNYCLSWDETKEWAQLLELSTVPELYRGKWDEELIKKLYTPTFQDNECEGYVVRLVESFYYADFNKKAAKYVRARHVSTDRHWMQNEVVANTLKEGR